MRGESATAHLTQYEKKTSKQCANWQARWCDWVHTLFSNDYNFCVRGGVHCHRLIPWSRVKYWWQQQSIVGLFVVVTVWRIYCCRMSCWSDVKYQGPWSSAVILGTIDWVLPMTRIGECMPTSDNPLRPTFLGSVCLICYLLIVGSYRTQLITSFNIKLIWW